MLRPWLMNRRGSESAFKQLLLVASVVRLGSPGDIVSLGRVDVGYACPYRFSIRNGGERLFHARTAAPGEPQKGLCARDGLSGEGSMKFFAEADVRRLLHWKPLIDAMETALAEFSAGKVIQPVRNMITIEEGKRYLGIMPAVGEQAMGLKLVSFYPGNAGTAVPTHLGLIILSRPDTGEPLAVMDGRLITEMRTAAVSAAVTRCVAPARAPILALLGSGVQAAAHLEALSCVRSFDDVRVWSRSADNARRFAEQHRAKAMA